MVVQNPEKQEKEEKATPDFQYAVKIEPDSIACDKEISFPYEKKYYALLNRCETIQQSNERLVNRIYHVKKLIRRCRKQRKFLMNRLDLYNDDYRNGFRSLFAEMYGDSSPAQSNTEPKHNQPSSSTQASSGATLHHVQDPKVETITLG